MCRTWSSCKHMTIIKMGLSIKPQATVYETKSTDMHNCNTESVTKASVQGRNFNPNSSVAYPVDSAMGGGLLCGVQ